MTRFVAFLLVLAALVSGRPAAAQDMVDVALVLLADGSGSIDPEEFQLQREGYAEALTSPEVLSAIRSNPSQRIGVVFVEWGAPSSQEIIVDWTVIDGEASAADFAAKLRGAPKKTFGYNSISNALDFGVRLLGSAPFTAGRQVIDVSGDGPNIGGRDILQARDEAVAKGITINALAIRQPGSVVAPSLGMPLEEYYRQNVIGGPGAFVETADGRGRFAQAIRNKLVLEIAALETAPRPHNNGG
ncbi:hypothetical protein IZ6_09980 [Terrihabitans soli]|uniref:DUF1194 domain-containing protein n=1 Tax=Terrihabitans soli TaxID=708113 RepID=A0A6S6QGJ9_9HYPH|nr:DUF1194 domain-containing protein [Terrihabitans soli]BCJ90263.1 hypothetical protein IZ6_09980 [Terrihabitans soli]